METIWQANQGWFHVSREGGKGERWQNVSFNPAWATAVGLPLPALLTNLNKVANGGKLYHCAHGRLGNRCSRVFCCFIFILLLLCFILILHFATGQLHRSRWIICEVALGSFQPNTWRWPLYALLWMKTANLEGTIHFRIKALCGQRDFSAPSLWMRTAVELVWE